MAESDSELEEGEWTLMGYESTSLLGDANTRSIARASVHNLDQPIMTVEEALVVVVAESMGETLEGINLWACRVIATIYVARVELQAMGSHALIDLHHKMMHLIAGKAYIGQ